MFREFDLVDEKKLTHCINQNHGNQKVANYLKFLQESQYHQTQSRYSTIENEAEWSTIETCDFAGFCTE